MPSTSMPSRLGADGGRADDAVDAGCGSAADEDGELLLVLHFNRVEKVPKRSSVRSALPALSMKASLDRGARRVKRHCG